MSEERAQIVERGGNIAVTWLPGRRFPGIHIQGDTFANLLHGLRAAENAEERDYLLAEMDEMLRFYESALEGRGLTLPYSA